MLNFRLLFLSLSTLSISIALGTESPVRLCHSDACLYGTNTQQGKSVSYKCLDREYRAQESDVIYWDESNDETLDSWILKGYSPLLCDEVEEVDEMYFCPDGLCVTTIRKNLRHQLDDPPYQCFDPLLQKYEDCIIGYSATADMISARGYHTEECTDPSQPAESKESKRSNGREQMVPQEISTLQSETHQREKRFGEEESDYIKAATGTLYDENGSQQIQEKNNEDQKPYDFYEDTAPRNKMEDTPKEYDDEGKSVWQEVVVEQIEMDYQRPSLDKLGQSEMDPYDGDVERDGAYQKESDLGVKPGIYVESTPKADGAMGDKVDLEYGIPAEKAPSDEETYVEVGEPRRQKGYKDAGYELDDVYRIPDEKDEETYIEVGEPRRQKGDKDVYEPDMLIEERYRANKPQGQLPVGQEYPAEAPGEEARQYPETDRKQIP